MLASFRWPSRRFATLFVYSGLFWLCYPFSAEAHVKWFAPFDITAPPKPLAEVLTLGFWQWTVVSAAALWLCSLIGRTELGAALLRSIDHPSTWLRNNSEYFMRAGVAAFFISLWVLGTVIITPELKTNVAAISWLQAGIALGMLWRRTLILSALGICFLYVFAIAHYGPFHMADYPIFLGAAAYLGLTGLGIQVFGMRPIDVARWGAGITLMWASIEKWAYPEWTFPLLERRPHLTMGIDAELYMLLAGVIEFVLAFALLWTPFVRRISAIILGTMFISAVFEFGKIDAIGHMLIIVMLLIFAADDEPKVERPPILAPTYYGIALVITCLAYYGLHAIVFGSKIL